MSGTIAKWVWGLLLLWQPLWSSALEGDKKVWEKETRDLFYEGESSLQDEGTTYMDTLSEERGEVREERDRKRREREAGISQNEWRSAPPAWLKWLGYIAIGLIVVFLIYLVVRAIDPGSKPKAGNRQINSSVFEENPESLEEAGLDIALQQALNSNDLRLAVRVMFLNTLRHLENQGIILWRKSKTNREYVLEAGQKIPVDELKMVVLIYEQVWFGNAMVNDKFLNSYERLVHKLTGRDE